MYLKKIKIKNFKSIKNLTINFDENFNVIIGSNNSGKSTVFEAIRLWNLAFDAFLKERSNTSNSNSSFYATQYFFFNLEQLAFLRITELKELFNNKARKNIEITLTFARHKYKLSNRKYKNYIKFECKKIDIDNTIVEVDIPIAFTKTSEKVNLRFSLYTEKNQREKCSADLLDLLSLKKGSSLKNAFLCTYIKPIFSIVTNEPKYAEAYFRHKLNLGQVDQVLRNLIEHNLKINDNQNKIQEIIKRIFFSNINQDIENIFELESKFDPDKDKFLKIIVNNKILNSKVELSLLGSGLLNVLNILSVFLYGYQNFKLSLMLLDEPDSHLHYNNQKELYENLNQLAQQTKQQIFIITHNHELITSSEKIIYLDPEQSVISPTPSDDIKIYKELSEDYYKLVKNYEEYSRIISISNKPILKVEGASDLRILKLAYSKLYGRNLEEYFELIDDSYLGKQLIFLKGASGVGKLLTEQFIGNKTIIGIVDHDIPGLNALNEFKKLQDKIEGEITEISSFHYKIQDRHLLLLPIPMFREKQAKWFENNVEIEYLFTDDILKNHFGVTNLSCETGNTYEKFIGDSHKKLVSNQDKLESLDKKNFENFRILFEELLSCIQKT